MTPAFVISNENKLASAEEILGFNLERKEIELEETQSIETGKSSRNESQRFI